MKELVEGQVRRLSTARWLGLAGGAIGVVVWLLAFLTALVGGLFFQFEGGDLWLLSTAFATALLFPALGILGGAIALTRPGRAVALLAIAAIGSLIVLRPLWLLYGPFLVAGAVLARLGPPATSEQRPT